MKTNKNIQAIVVFLFVLLLSSLKISAQPYFDIANIYYQQSPANSKTDGNPLQTDLISTNLQAAFPVKKDYVVINPFCDYYQLQFMEADADVEKQKLYGIGMALTYLKQWKNEKWSTAFVAIPRLNSDFKKVDANDYQMGGVVLGIYKKNKNLSYKFGAYYNSEYFGPFIIPLVGIEWKPTEKLNIFGVIPNQMNIEYKFNKIFYGGVEMVFIINSYRYENSSFLRMDDNHIKIYLDTYITKNIVLNLQAGQSIFRKYQMGIRENGTTNYTDLNVNDGVLFRAGIVYRLRLDEKKTEN